MNRNDDEPELIERRSCQEPPRRWPQVPRETGVLVTSLAGAPVAAEAASAWSLVFDGFDQVSEGIREALCTLGNGYFATRAAAAWAVADGVHYPGTYLAGGYNRLRTNIAGRVVENEDLVNFPNWLALNFRIADEGWFDARTVTLLSYRQELDLRRGMLLRTIHFEDQQGRRALLQEQRLVSMADMHLGALELTLTAENWSGSVTVRSAIDGRVVNAGAKLYHKFNNKHLEPLAGEIVGNDGVYLLVRTSPVACPCRPGSTNASRSSTGGFSRGGARSSKNQAISARN